MSRVFPLLIVGAIALSACAPTTAAKPAETADGVRQCFYADRVDNFRGDGQTIYVRARTKEVFELQSFGVCPDIDFAYGITFLPNSGVSRLCAGDLTRILTSGGSSPRTECRVQVVKKLTEAEVAALPSRSRP